MSFQLLRHSALRSGVLSSARAFSTNIEGTVNDPTPFPAPNKAHGSYHWTFERLLSGALVPLVGATAVTSVHPILDGVLAVAIVAHSHMGLDQVLIDYVHPNKFPVIGTISKWLVRIATGGVLVGVYQFNTNDIGLTELVKKAWHA
ncbi:BZ3500_MvSof-1268-A1-R1_Chr6-2g08499 [Microbotryum saponariae]|uniref:Succinate dehydrogenase [ubiquinone] cytochrome b small subunit n=1 Tax=Microbotryum saponariae TaxID=289078 RepID=A0A2X0NNJ4_9BASI|nr:BZ3500_MvSof-1268-A1-R1_Chr6-2g08499 [Microbotryum saponariae]SDA07776.1 BZ3501_MvSof-1269-A2-R1_Chr6-1g08213 [Microbotryum saponariae]